MTAAPSLGDRRRRQLADLRTLGGLMALDGTLVQVDGGRLGAREGGAALLGG
jgi:hypothetical protein